MSLWSRIKGKVKDVVGAAQSASQGDVMALAPYLAALSGAGVAANASQFTGMSDSMLTPAANALKGNVPLTLGTATGATVGYEAVKALQGVATQPYTAEAPPDVNLANDPDTSAQFKRLRNAAKMLGRAGTFKNKGTNTSLGLGDTVLGDQLSLIGS